MLLNLLVQLRNRYWVLPWKLNKGLVMHALLYANLKPVSSRVKKISVYYGLDTLMISFLSGHIHGEDKLKHFRTS